ncbi:hypothetical protein HanIR_Chr15g0770661 [Helianthus annuus]|nr:hypothetical protein HanIR_Chr15g0770661 [Helianthus annuus]
MLLQMRWWLLVMQPPLIDRLFLLSIPHLSKIVLCAPFGILHVALDPLHSSSLEKEEGAWLLLPVITKENEEFRPV